MSWPHKVNTISTIVFFFCLFATVEQLREIQWRTLEDINYLSVKGGFFLRAIIDQTK